MKKTLILISIMLSAVLLSGCNLKDIGQRKDAIITVNGEKITKAQYEAALEKNANSSALAQFGIDYRKDENSYFYVANKQKVVNELIFKAILDQEIKKRKIKITQDDMDKAYAEIIDKLGGKDKFSEVLKQNNVSQATFKKDLKEELKLRKLVDTLGVVKVSDKDAEKYYKQNIKEFNVPEKVKSSYIMISADPVQIKDVLLAKAENKKLSKEELDKKIKEEVKAKEEKAKTVLAKVKQDPTSFAKMAKENSDDAFTANEGGALGFLAKEEMPEAYAKVAFAQKPNTISDLVVTPYGYYIIMVTDRQKAGLEPFEKVRPELKQYLEMQKKAELFQKFAEKAKTEAKIEYADNAYNPEEIEKQLKEIQKKNPSLMEAVSAKE